MAACVSVPLSWHCVFVCVHSESLAALVEERRPQCASLITNWMYGGSSGGSGLSRGSMKRVFPSRTRYSHICWDEGHISCLPCAGEWHVWRWSIAFLIWHSSCGSQVLMSLPLMESTLSIYLFIYLFVWWAVQASRNMNDWAQFLGMGTSIRILSIRCDVGWILAQYVKRREILNILSRLALKR